MSFKDPATALMLLMPNRDQLEIIHAAKNFKVVTTGPDESVVWFTQTLNMSETIASFVLVHLAGRRQVLVFLMA
jgi:trimethylamine-N-oxide reductase (cytochrome c)